MATTILSIKIWIKMAKVVAPMALRTPISRTRSVMLANDIHNPNTAHNKGDCRNDST